MVLYFGSHSMSLISEVILPEVKTTLEWALTYSVLQTNFKKEFFKRMRYYTNQEKCKPTQD